MGTALLALACSSMLANMVVIQSVVRAGTTAGEMKYENQDSMTSTTPGTYTKEMWNSIRLWKANPALRLAKDPKNKEKQVILKNINDDIFGYLRLRSETKLQFQAFSRDTTANTLPFM